MLRKTGIFFHISPVTKCYTFSLDIYILSIILVIQRIIKTKFRITYNKDNIPFTCSHPALIIPLRWYGFVLSALIIGSMAPDFEYFIRFSTTRTISHTIPGVFTFCLPAGFIVFLLYHKLF